MMIMRGRRNQSIAAAYSFKIDLALNTWHKQRSSVGTHGRCTIGVLSQTCSKPSNALHVAALPPISDVLNSRVLFVGLFLLKTHLSLKHEFHLISENPEFTIIHNVQRFINKSKPGRLHSSAQIYKTITQSSTRWKGLRNALVVFK